ncbi:hypothetical protein V6N11_004843 [Hibiscus sabdariffa]|uniref:NEP1-interacting protein 1 n=1 Tax=Hibiscus sabdariffa TaxID=183260 RepID=A0ABR2SHI6_9ROSI
MLKEWFSAMKDHGIGFLIQVSKRTVFAVFTCIFALGGAMVGTVVGAMEGQTTETGFFNGAGIGAVAGAITAVQLLESLADEESISKVALLISLVNGKAFIEWVSPAMLKAYQWQMNSLDSTYREITDLYDVNGAKGLSRSCIQKLPMHEFQSSELNKSDDSDQLSCSICLQGYNINGIHWFHDCKENDKAPHAELQLETKGGGPTVSSRALSQDITMKDQTELLLVHEQWNRNRII